MNYVRREGNKVAHTLAALALKEELNMVWLYTPPKCIQDMLQVEISASPLSDNCNYDAVLFKKP